MHWVYNWIKKFILDCFSAKTKKKLYHKLVLMWFMIFFLFWLDDGIPIKTLFVKPSEFWNDFGSKNNTEMERSMFTAGWLSFIAALTAINYALMTLSTIKEKAIRKIMRHSVATSAINNLFINWKTKEKKYLNQELDIQKIETKLIAEFKTKLEDKYKNYIARANRIESEKDIALIGGVILAILYFAFLAFSSFVNFNYIKLTALIVYPFILIPACSYIGKYLDMTNEAIETEAGYLKEYKTKFSLFVTHQFGLTNDEIVRKNIVDLATKAGDSQAKRNVAEEDFGKFGTIIASSPGNAQKLSTKVNRLQADSSFPILNENNYSGSYVTSKTYDPKTGNLKKIISLSNSEYSISYSTKFDLKYYAEDNQFLSIIYYDNFGVRRKLKNKTEVSICRSHSEMKKSISIFHIVESYSKFKKSGNILAEITVKII